MLRFFLIALVLFGFSACKSTRLPNSNQQDFILATGKALTKAWALDKIKQLFPKANLEADSLYLEGSFSNKDARRIITDSAADFFTEKGGVTAYTQGFFFEITWKADPDTVGKTRIRIVYVRKPKTACIMLHNVHKAIADKLKADIPEINQIDRWNNQPNRQEEGLIINPPSAYIEFAAINWENSAKKNIQQATAQIRIHVVQRGDMRDTQTGAPNADEALSETYGLVDKVYITLQGFTTDFFTPFNRISVETDTVYGTEIVDTITFQTRFTDTSKLDDINKVTVTPSLVVSKP